MEEWALRSMHRWPNVPALFGWLGLDARGRWLIQGEIITRPQIIDTINRNYEADAHGRWFFQNGPQRGYVALERAALVLRAVGEQLLTHTHLPVERPSQVCIDEAGSIWMATERGPGALLDTDLDWALAHLHEAGRPPDEASLMHTLSLPSGSPTALMLQFATHSLPVDRVDQALIPQRFGFIRDPQPLDGETAATRASDR